MQFFQTRENQFSQRFIHLRYQKKDLPHKQKFTNTQLDFKVTILLGHYTLTSASGVSGLLNLDVTFMTRTEDKYSFHFNKLSIFLRQGLKPPLLKFLGYPDDKDLDWYLLHTSELKKVNKQLQLLLGHVKPDKEMFPQRFLDWTRQYVVRWY